MTRIGIGTFFVVGCLVVGCGQDDSADTDPVGTEGTNNTTDEDTVDPVTDTVGETMTVGETDETTDGPAIPTARGGIYIDWVEANQGIGVEVGRDGLPVGGEGRTAYLIRDRITLIRAFWVVPEDWVPREIEARLTLHFPDNTTETKTRTIMVEGESFIGDLSRSFYFGLEADRVVPGVTYDIELFETDPTYFDLPPGDIAARMPYEGTAAIGIEDSYMRLKAIVVPFDYNANGCNTKLTFPEDTYQLFYDYMLMMNPVDTLELVIHEPIAFNQPIQSLGQMNSILANLRFEDGESPDNPEVYYYGVIDPCSNGVGGAAGLANGIPVGAMKGQANQRVSSGVLRSAADQGDVGILKVNADTWVHEVGHTQGRRHIACSGEAGVDPNYPNPGGAIGEWGWGVSDFLLRHKTTFKDYMTYCNPAWVSTFGWNLVFPNIATLSSWDFEDRPDGMDPDELYGGRLLVGSIYPSGDEDWYTVPGSVDPKELSAVHHLTFESGGELVADVAAKVDDLDDGTLMLTVPLPEGYDAVDQIRRLNTVEGTTMPVEVATQPLRLKYAAAK